MRQIVLDYIESPSKKLKGRLTTMELAWAEKQIEAKSPKKAVKPVVKSEG
jgi:hypothetical protein